MGRFDSTKTAIDVNITQNGNQEITGSILNSVLNNMVDATDAQLDILQEAIPTKLSDLEQDIPIGSYDDTELRERIEENEVLIEDLYDTKIDREADDYYPQLAVGLADNLSGVDVVDSEVNFRRSGGGAISDGVARIEAIKGNSVVWNQQSSSETLGNGVNLMPLPLGATIVEGNKYLILCDLECSLYLYYNKGEGNKSVTSIYNKSSLFFTSSVSCTSNGKHSVEGGLWWHLTAAIDAPFHARLIDLTKAFPNDWQNINTIEEFYQRIPMGVDLNAYNEGEVIHMDVQSIESQGVNQWGGELEEGRLSNGEPTTGGSMIRSKEFMRVLPSTSYFPKLDDINGGKVFFYPSFYDSDYNFISTLSGLNNQRFDTPSNAVYMRFFLYCSGQSVPLDYDICINLYDTSINGKYFPYVKRTEDLSIIRKYFPDGMKSAGTAHDEIRYNKASGKWEKVEAIGIRAYQEGDADNAVYLTDGKVTCYPLAKPIVTELDAEDQFKDLDYQVWNCGTEKAIAEGKSAPLAADITYGFNAIGKIKELESLVAALRAKVGI